MRTSPTHLIRAMGQLLRGPVLCLMLMMSVGAAAAPAQSQAPERERERERERPPNIVFILSDDHRWDHMSAMGHPYVRTPHLDRLAREGVTFTNAFVATSLCSPSRASFLTGQYPQGHGVQNNFTKWNPSNRTFLEDLKGAGYRTAFIGKWHMPGGIPALQGVDLFVTFDHVSGQGAYYGTPYIVNGKRIPLGEEVMSGITAQGYITTDLTDMAIAYMQQADDRPFALYLSHKAVHLPMTPSEQFAGRHRNTDIELPEEADRWVAFANGNYVHLLWGALEERMRAYAETVEAMDHEIGRVMDALEEAGLAENTIVIYTSDNGYLWGEHRQIDKRWAYEESIRIPFIVRAPGLADEAGRTLPGTVLNIDLAPTMRDLVGLDPASGQDGRSFLPLLTGEAQEIREDWLYSYFVDYPYRVPSLNAVRDGRYKLVVHERGLGAQLFDLQTDPGETRNLIDDPDHADVRVRLERRLQDLLASATPGGEAGAP